MTMENENKLQILIEKAKSGDPNSQLLCGIFLSDTMKRYEEAFSYLQQSAEKENVIAQYRVGDCYLNGKGVKKDAQKGFKWLSKAAGRGYADAQLAISTCFFSATGVKRSPKSGFEWLMKAAEQGNVKAMNGIGLCYMNGLGTNISYTQAAYWFEKSVEKGYKTSIMALGDCYAKNGKYEDAFVTYKKAADNGDTKAQLIVAQMYQDGKGVDADEQQTIKYLEKAASLGSEEAVEQLKIIRENQQKVEEYINSMKKNKSKMPNLGIIFWIIFIVVAILAVLFYQQSNN